MFSSDSQCEKASESIIITLFEIIIDLREEQILNKQEQISLIFIGTNMFLFLTGINVLLFKYLAI